MTSIGAEELVALWRAEEREQPPGWDFSDLADRMRESREEWDFDALTRAALADASRVLDMGTGGGEQLLRFADLLPQDTVATEGWAPNVPVAVAALTPHGVPVVEYGAPDEAVDSVPMPFPDDRFDLVLNRHESFSAIELSRVIAPGGVLLTQQVGGDECAELGEVFGEHRELPHVTLNEFAARLGRAGFEVVAGAEHVGRYVFDDVAAMLGYLQLVPWETPDDFSVDRYREPLLALHERSGGGEVALTRKRFWLRAVRS